jgi:hypothetical protein
MVSPFSTSSTLRLKFLKIFWIFGTFGVNTAVLTGSRRGMVFIEAKKGNTVDGGHDE